MRLRDHIEEELEFALVVYSASAKLKFMTWTAVALPLVVVVLGLALPEPTPNPPFDTVTLALHNVLMHRIWPLLVLGTAVASWIQVAKVYRQEKRRLLLL